MTMRNRRGRLFTCDHLTLTMLAAASGVASQIISDLGAAFVTKSGRELNHVTASHFWVKGVYRQLTGVTGAAGSWDAYSLGIVRATVGVDNTDLPDLQAHSGDLVLHDCRVLRATRVDNDPMDPVENSHGSSFELESRGQRKLARVDDTLFLAVQKDGVTAQDVILDVAVSILWLLP